MMKLSIIIVTYNSARHILPCIESLLESRRIIPFEIIVVDNNSSDQTSSILTRFEQSITFIKNKSNSGYAGGNNIGVSHATGDLLLFLNPDTIINADALIQMCETFDKIDNVGIVGPRLLNMDNTIQWYYCKDYSLTDIVYRRLCPQSSLKRSGLQDVFNVHNKVPIEVDWVLGSAIMIYKNTFKEIGQFNKSYRLYFEDVDLCRTARKKGYKVLYNPLSQIYHNHQRESAKGFSKKTIWHIQSAIKYFNFHGWKL